MNLSVIKNIIMVKIEDKQPKTKTINRGISSNLIEAFKHSPIFRLYLEHSNELLICIRNNYLNVYYHLNNIAEIRLNGEKNISCAILPKFLRQKGKKNIILNEEQIQSQIIERYEDIKRIIQCKENSTYEKIVQQKLFLQNNANPSSKWFCVDVEWARAFKDIYEKKEADMSSRMDIIAISKEVPHRVAIIELKYGKQAVDGNAGIIKHIEDFIKIKEGKNLQNGNRIDYYDGMCSDICNIIEAYKYLGIEVPELLMNINNNEFATSPEFYIMTVNNNSESNRGTTPKQTIAAYLFTPDSHNYIEWNCKRKARENVQDKLGINVLDTNSELPVTFIFSKQKVDDINISDILEDKSYEILRPIQTLIKPYGQQNL